MGLSCRLLLKVKGLFSNLPLLREVPCGVQRAIELVALEAADLATVLGEEVRATYDPR